MCACEGMVHRYTLTLCLPAHANDPAGHVYDILAYNEAVRVARSYVDARPVCTPVTRNLQGLDKSSMPFTNPYNPYVAERPAHQHQRP